MFKATQLYNELYIVFAFHFLARILTTSGLRVGYQYKRGALVKVENGYHFQLMRIGGDGLKALVGRILRLGRNMAFCYSCDGLEIKSLQSQSGFLQVVLNA